MFPDNLENKINLIMLLINKIIKIVIVFQDFNIFSKIIFETNRKYFNYKNESISNEQKKIRNFKR